MAKKIFILLNSTSEYDFADLLNKYVKNASINIGDTLPAHPSDYDLVVLWNYKKIIPDVSRHHNVILFHSSSLPEGKGWAPVYHSIADGFKHYVITCLFCHDEVDAGDIILKCRFALKDNHTAAHVRKWDSEISCMLIGELLRRIESGPLTGTKQSGPGTFFQRRKPSDNEISTESKISEVFNHLRACEDRHPAFFFFNGIKYIISIHPDVAPGFPEDLEITTGHDIDTFHRWDHANSL